MRATCLALVVLESRDGSESTYDHALLADQFARDQDPTVRRASVRLAGYIGHDPEGIDLEKLLADTTLDSPLFTDTLRARELWTQPNLY